MESDTLGVYKLVILMIGDIKDFEAPLLVSNHISSMPI